MTTNYEWLLNMGGEERQAWFDAERDTPTVDYSAEHVDMGHESRENYTERLYEVPVSDCPYCGCDRVVIHDFSDLYERPHSYRVEHVDEKEAFNCECFESYYAFDSIEKAVQHADMREGNVNGGEANGITSFSVSCDGGVTWLPKVSVDETRERLEADAERYVCDATELQSERDYWRNQVQVCLDNACMHGGKPVYNRHVMDYPLLGGFTMPCTLVVSVIDNLRDFYADEKRINEELREKVKNQSQQLAEVQVALEKRNKGEMKRQWKKEIAELKAKLEAYEKAAQGEFVVLLEDAMKFTTDQPGYVKAYIAELQSERDELLEKLSRAIGNAHDTISLVDLEGNVSY